MGCLGISSVLAALPPKFLSVEVLEDVPGKLLLEITNPNYYLRPVGGSQGLQVNCGGCLRNGTPGSPDLPVYRFDVLTGPAAPQINIRILESETQQVGEGLAPYPKELSPTRNEYRPDAKLYREASELHGKLLLQRTLRGVPIRGLEIPLAQWSEVNKTLTVVKKAQVEILFNGVLGRPASNRLEASFQSSVKNPIGGAYLYSSSRPNILRKNSASSFTLSSHLIRFKVGDKNVENLDEDGLYAVSFSDLVRVTPELNGVKNESLRLYTGGNDTLPRPMTSTILPGTLREIQIEVVDKRNDGTFDEGDSIRFFAHGSSLWKRLQGTRGPIRYEFLVDPYSFENFYYLDYSGEGKSGSARRLDIATSLKSTSVPKTSDYAYLRAEKDLRSASCDQSQPSQLDEETGFDWFWYFRGGCIGDSALTLTKSQLASHETDTLVDLDQSRPGDSIYVGVYVFHLNQDKTFGLYSGGSGERLKVLDVPVEDTSVHPTPTYSPGSYYVWTKPLKNPPVFQLDSLQWSRGKRFEGYTVSYRRKFVYSGKPLWIFPSEFGKNISYKIHNGEGLVCLRVEDGVATRKFILGSEGIFTDSLSIDADAKYYLFKNTVSLAQNSIEQEILPAIGTALHNLETGDGENPEYLIVTPKELMGEAIKLKEYRNSPNRGLRLKTSVVRVEDIYRQFSSGRMSPTAIRDFLRWAYNGWGSATRAPSQLKYVLLYGDGHYDYRNIRAQFKKSSPPNLIPPYEFFNDDSEVEIASEEFFGALDSNDNDPTNVALDIAIGRLPIQNVDQAAGYLQKVKDFEDPEKAGEWRGRIVMAADDANQRGNPPNNLDPITTGHTTDTDSIGKLILRNEPGIAIDKVYLLDYPLNSAFHKPEASQDLISLINRGTLLINYVGHGASNQWADEVLLQTNDAISRMRNFSKTPMINAFSCTVGRFESLDGEGMSEQFVKAKGIGAIAAISATRESYPGPNIRLAEAFYERVFPVDSSYETSTVGKALQDAKNSSATQEIQLNDAKYALLGEPVLLLRKPHLALTLSQYPDTIQALDCNVIKGTVTGGSGRGFINIKILAGSNHKTYNLPSPMVAQEVDKRGNILFERTLPYKDNAFETNYFIPKQISFGDSTAQILVFAWDAKEEREGSFAKLKLRIKGTSKSACATDTDGKGPKIKITGCQTKETGEIDLASRVQLSLPNCLKIQVEDSIGGVLTGEGPDEGTTLEVPGVLEPFHPQPGVDELYLKTYQLTLDKQNFKPGQHLLKVSARDGYGNIGSRQLNMELTVDSSIHTVSAYNVPNPMKRNGTVFYFSTILPSQELDFLDPTAKADTTERVEFEIRIFNQTGNLVQVFQRAQSGVTTWDGRDNWGNLLGNGVYFYKVTARQSLSSFQGVRPSYRTLSSKRNVLVLSR